MGVKEFAVISNGTVKKNINKSARLKKLEKQLKREQRCLSRKYEDLKKRNKKMKGEATRQNIKIQVLKVQRLHHRIDNIRTDYINKTIAEIVNNHHSIPARVAGRMAIHTMKVLKTFIVKRQPSFICMEDLNVKGMMKNRHLSKAVQQQCFGEFRRQMEYKAMWNNISVVIADKFYPSSKLCSCCGNMKKDLKLSDRIYRCECGNVIDRDYQASLNLKRYGERALNKSVA